jgi:hypothetical protein
MPNLDDDQFEAHLATFCPLQPAAFPALQLEPRPPRSFFLWRAAATAIVILALTVGFFPRKPLTRVLLAPAPQVSEPRTIRNTASLLAHSPSFEKFVSEVPMRPATSPIASNESAIAVLSKEKIKL